MNQIKKYILKPLYLFSKKGLKHELFTILVYYCKNKLLSQLLHEKRVPKGTHCSEGFVTVERLFKHGVSSSMVLL